MELWIVSAVICAVLSALVASAKGRSGFGWFFLSLIFGIFALIIVACLSSIKSQPKRYSDPVKTNSDGKICPNCAETIKLNALACRFCGVEFIKTDTPSDVRRQEITAVIAIVIVGIVVLAYL